MLRRGVPRRLPGHGVGGQLGVAAASHLLLPAQRRGAGRLGGAAAGEYLRLSGETVAWTGWGGR